MFTSGEIHIPDTGMRLSQMYSPDDVLEKKVKSAKENEKNNESITNLDPTRQVT